MFDVEVLRPHSITDHTTYVSIVLAETICLLSRSRLILPALASIGSLKPVSVKLLEIVIRLAKIPLLERCEEEV